MAEEDPAAVRVLLGLCVRLLRNDWELSHVERRGLELVGGARTSGPAGSCGTTSLRLSAAARVPPPDGLHSDE